MEEEKKDVTVNTENVVETTSSVVASTNNVVNTTNNVLPPAFNVVNTTEDKAIVEAPKDNKKKSKEKIKLNKFNRILSRIVIAILVMTFLLCLLQFTNVNFSNYMWVNINNKLSAVEYSIMQNFKLLSTYGSIILLVIGGVIFIASLFIEVLFKNNLEKKTKATNILLPFALIGIFFLNFLLFDIFSDLSHRGINEIYMRDNMNATYTQKDLENVIDYFKNRIIVYSESLDRVGKNININKKPYDLVIEDLENLAVKYEFLKGGFPTKIHTLSDYELESSGYPTGLTSFFTVSLDNNLTDLEKIFTLTHELCHVKGIIRESDANYCAFLSGYNSNSDVSKYAMYLSIMPNLLEALKNEELYYNIMNELGTMCIESEYGEICNLYYKDVYRYINSSDKLELYTYSLNVYKEYKEELKQYLLGLKNRFNITIKDEENKELSLEEANKLIDDESTMRLSLISNITESKYNENQKYLVTISNYFPHLYLSNSNESYPDYSSYDYLKPYPVGNYVALTEKEPEFGYDRVVRSILEYFDKYIFN